MVICITEDRTKEEIAVKLLLLSLARHCPDTPIVLTYPPASPQFARWVAATIPGCTLRTARVSGSSGWNIKADALLGLLAEGHDEVWWLDSDIIVTGNFIERYRDIPPATLVVCEEALYGAYRDDGARTRGWGFPVARSLPYSLNTGVMRVSTLHLDLLKRWKVLLEDERYRAAQKDFWHRRPIHLMGDQDVLSALLGAEPFAETPMYVLQRGRDILQYFGFSAYTTRERLANLRHGPPAFIHCQGWKPWTSLAPERRASDIKTRLQNLYIELSPYSFAAESYRNQLDAPLPWLEHLSPMARLFRLLGFHHAALTGLPIAMLIDLVRAVKGSGRRPAGERA
ncbi:nucleotide-diphospho-sugar transferase [Methylotetracoccus oryzae]|uniref:nucleotide-diphospho-sugar transferase n=1 Tax=Methylotetracoccus oryzae TaxID=1919059 RepID=UPI00111A1BB8|nr:nucleotide-diphospho-sugar transferase [Methylotetracoccus oryzae]